jgi:hypothetical protein
MVRPTDEKEYIFMKDLWGGMFDFNSDGVMDLGEEYLVYKIYEAVTEESEDQDEDEELWSE